MAARTHNSALRENSQERQSSWFFKADEQTENPRETHIVWHDSTKPAITPILPSEAFLKAEGSTSPPEKDASPAQWAEVQMSLWTLPRCLLGSAPASSPPEQGALSPRFERPGDVVIGGIFDLTLIRSDSLLHFPSRPLCRALLCD